MKAGAGKRFDGKTAIVTGASGGIGGAIGDGFLREGGTVLGVGRDPDALRSFAKQREGAKLDTAVVDLRDATAIQDFMASAVERVGSCSSPGPWPSNSPTGESAATPSPRASR